ncbi:hypothetical protein EMPS_05226 [Entomortierella parvispora]|uniref:Uncharacterized protein n=1 Tax=Entomortierella parvispora TaxID=205924 RepID=A0A9P3HAG7_9FUNG|nr:hypothetical protein EMPS_05226 [Entomortierella parvispora]
MLQAPAASSQPPSPSASSPSASVTVPHKVGHHRRPSDLTCAEMDEGLLGVLSPGPQSAALNAKTVFHSVSPTKKSAVDQHILRSCQEFNSHAPQPQPSSSSYSSPSQQPLPALHFSGSTTSGHPSGRFFTPGSFFSPPCTRIGLGTTSPVGGISAGSSPALKRTQLSAESNHSPQHPHSERQRALSHTNGTFSPQPHHHQSSVSCGPRHGHGSACHHAAASAPSVFRPILSLMAASTASSTIKSNAPAVVGLPASWSNEDLPSPIYNHGSNDNLHRHGAAPSGAVFPNRSASTSSESVTEVAALSANRRGGDDGGGLQPLLEIRIQSPGLSSVTVTGSSFVEEVLHPFADAPPKDIQSNSKVALQKDSHGNDTNDHDENDKYLATTPLLDLQEQGYVVVGSVGLRDFEEETPMRPELVIDTTITHKSTLPQRQEESKVDGNISDNPLPVSTVGLEYSAEAPLSASLDERYWLPTMSIEDLGAIQEEFVETMVDLPEVTDLIESLPKSEIEPTEDQAEDHDRQCVGKETLLFSDLVPISLKEMEDQLMQEQATDSAPRTHSSDDTQTAEEDDVLVIHIDFERLIRLCANYEREKEEWRQLWVRGGGLELDLTFDDGELETSKTLEQQQAEEEEILRSSCIIDMEGLLGCSWQQLKDQEMEQRRHHDNLTCTDGEVLLKEEPLKEVEEIVKEVEKEGEETEETTMDTSLLADDLLLDPMPLARRVQFDPMIQVFIIEDSSPQSVTTEEDGIDCANLVASPSPEWVAFRVFRPDHFTVLSDQILPSTSPKVREQSEAKAVVALKESLVQEPARHVLSIATTANYPPLPPSPLLDTSESQTDISSPISASSESSQSSTSTVTSQTDTNYNMYISVEKEALESEITSQTTAVAFIETSLDVSILCPLSHNEKDDTTPTPTSPRTLELKATRMQLQYWIETAARLRDREVILTDKIDELVQDMASMLDIYQDAEMGRQATEMAVQELKQELAKEQEIGFASIQEAALSIQEKQVLEMALAATRSELELLREAWSSQKASVIEEQQRSEGGVEEADHPVGNPINDKVLIDESGLGMELRIMTPTLQKSTAPAILKQATLALLFIFSTASLLVLLCGHQHQLYTIVHTFQSSILHWSHFITNCVRLELPQKTWVWQHPDYTHSGSLDATPILSSMEEWQHSLLQSDQAQWLLEGGSNWAEGQIQHWTLLFNTLSELWLDLTPIDIWRGYRLSPLRS